MDSKDYGVRVIRAYEQRRVGDVLFPPGMLRQALVRHGFVEQVIADEPEQEEDKKDHRVLRRSTLRAPC